MPKKVVLLLGILITLPYICAYLSAGEQHNFSGFLINPLDGNSYLAKMYQGWGGDWKYTLPFTSERGEGEYLFTFYLALGHISRIVGIPLIVSYHLTRIAAGILLAWMIWNFLLAVSPGNPHRTTIFTVAILGSGLGWLFFPFGLVTADFWIAEAYPFLSAYTNPHFCLSLALLLALLLPIISSDECQTGISAYRSPGWVMTILFSVLMTGMSPFALVLLIGTGISLVVWEIAAQWISSAKTLSEFQIRDLFNGQEFWDNLRHLALVFIGGFPVAFYLLLATRSNAALRIWDLQNIELSPPPWNLAAAFSPALLLAIPGSFEIVRTGAKRGRAVLIWTILAFALAYLPFNLQRRFMLGLFLPLTVLAGFGLNWAAQKMKIWKKWLPAGFLALSLPTTFLTLLIGQFGVYKQDPILYLEKRETDALAWIRENTGEHDLILADTRMGLFIPAHTGRRVIFGHDYETINAEQEEENIERFFLNAVTDPQSASDFLLERQVDYVLWVSQNTYQGELDQVQALIPVFEQDGVLIFKVWMDQVPSG